MSDETVEATEAVIESPVDVIDATETVEATEETVTEEQPDETKNPLRDEKGKFKGVQARIDELTRARREAERSADYWKGIATHSTALDTAPETAAKPTAEDFDDYDAYVEALTDWKVDNKTRDVAAKATQSAEVSFRQSNWNDRQAAVVSILPDYNEVVGSSDIELKQNVIDALMESERGPELAYHMATNPEYAAQLNKMSATGAALELGRLEASLDTPVSKPASKAPAPISPIERIWPRPIWIRTLPSAGSRERDTSINQILRSDTRRPTDGTTSCQTH
jgi:hypothetical protein